MERIEIKTVDDLINLAKSDLLTPEQFENLLNECKPFIGIYLNTYTKTSDMVTGLENLKQYAGETEKPIFLDTTIN